MSDRREASLPIRRALALALLLCACQVLGPPEPPPEGDGGTPCTAAVAIPASLVAVVAGACNPGCIRVAAGSAVTFFNQDHATYLFSTPGPPAFDLVLLAATSASTPALSTPGTVVIADVHSAASLTVLVQ